jgi:hypothetical protein
MSRILAQTAPGSTLQSNRARGDALLQLVVPQWDDRLVRTANASGFAPFSMSDTQ